MLITLNSNSTSQPLYRQIYDALRNRILRGELKPNEKLPSSRELAKQLGVSRTSVLEAYEQLISEGYLESRHGSGTYICETLPSELLTTAHHHRASKRNDAQPQNGSKISRTKSRLSQAAKLACRHLPSSFVTPSEKTPTIKYNFMAGSTIVDEHSEKAWQKLLSNSAKQGLSHRTLHQGDPALRQAIASHLQRTRNCQCNANNIVITNGSQQAFDILSRLLIDPGDQVAVEEPGYFGAKAAFAAHRAELMYIRTDNQGMDVAQLETKTQNNPTPPKLVYVTPSHQFPRGSVLPMERRIALMEWANKHNAFIIEDDYDSEYRYDGRPLESIQGIDNYGRTLYVGTFSKVIASSIRQGYVVLPEHLIAPFVQLRWAADVQNPSLQQAALAQWLSEGHHQRHLRRMQKIYSERRNELIGCLQQYFSNDEIDIEGTNSGLHIFIKFKTLPSKKQQDLNQGLKQLGIAAATPDFYYHRIPKHCTLVLGFSLIQQLAIEQGVKLLSKLVKQLTD